MFSSAVVVSSSGARVAATGATGWGSAVGAFSGWKSGRHIAHSAAQARTDVKMRPRSANERVRQIHTSPTGGKSRHSATFSAVRFLPVAAGRLRLGE